jgi:hypothetical protein
MKFTQSSIRDLIERLVNSTSYQLSLTYTYAQTGKYLPVIGVIRYSPTLHTVTFSENGPLQFQEFDLHYEDSYVIEQYGELKAYPIRELFIIEVGE